MLAVVSQIALVALTAPDWTWHYDVRVAEGLETMEVRVCFDDVAPKSLDLGLSGRLGYIDRKKARGLCFEYDVALGKMARAEDGHGQAAWIGADLMASPDAWLLRPAKIAGDVQATLKITLPPGVSAALPWPQKGDR